MRTAGLALAFAATAAWSVSAGEVLSVRDDFEPPELDRSKWATFQARPDSYRIDRTIVAQGEGALAITVEPHDIGCEGACQRNEIRIANELRVPFGTDTWYAFSFRIEGDVPRFGSRRWVIGQWKEDTDRSPFVAQRYDNGVFHITVQDGECRRVIAAAEGDYERLEAFFLSGTLPGSPFFSANRRSVDGLTFVGDPQHYDCVADLTLELGDSAVLPDPYGRWVRMVYHIRGGLDGQGLVEVWADGRFIVRVRGSIGHAEKYGPSQYFKIGMYRDPMPGTATVYFDAFRRGASRAEVEMP